MVVGAARTARTNALIEERVGEYAVAQLFFATRRHGDSRRVRKIRVLDCPCVCSERQIEMIEAADTEVDLTMSKQLLVDAEGKELR